MLRPDVQAPGGAPGGEAGADLAWWPEGVPLVRILARELTVMERRSATEMPSEVKVAAGVDEEIAGAGELAGCW